MKIKARDLTTQNLGQVITLDNGTTFGELSAVQFNAPEPGSVDLTIGGSLVVTLRMDDNVDITRNVVNAHQVRKEREAEEVGGMLTGGDLDEIEKIVRDLILINTTNQPVAVAV